MPTGFIVDASRFRVSHANREWRCFSQLGNYHELLHKNNLTEWKSPIQGNQLVLLRCG